MASRLAGKVCVITGTGGSMGRATALTFAHEGASVAGCDVTVESAAATVELVRAAGGDMVSLQPCHLGVLYNLAAREHFHPLVAVSGWALLGRRP